ncbi:hypothetical protein MTsPCn9_00370 [Croceitalea sp. MTPC9]|uniref:hypothetical protein n=1 Tax=unclassified Croceitalea TaxID=2632280 RepID=UPI002B3DC1B9|nr:hypothetical protein MTsPCn6_08340 [Croceitalea sp. MTPC6]GMN15101.1 hypothetical protein MTsPCn9_00370 [Croceitalea sp. MTPC9]
MDLEKIHKECRKIYHDGFYSIPLEENANEAGIFGYGPSNACKVYDKLTDEKYSSDNCIGENFNQLIQNVKDGWFENSTPTTNLSFYFMNYFLLLYLFVERVDLIFEVVNKDGKSKLFNDFQHHNFKTLRKINKWANFIKHPKEFLFTHWPTYFIEGYEGIEIGNEDVKIDTDFIFSHYHNARQPAPIILENNQRVFVEVPDLKKITEGFCKEMNVFFDFICGNQIVADFLRKKSTIEHYYEEENHESISEEE